MNDTILVETRGATATVTLNRPDVLNSFNRVMAEALQRALANLGDNDDVRCVLLTGAGRAFCAGQDLSEVVPEPGKTSQLADIVEGSYNPIIRQIRALEKPVVCGVNGVAAGAGANLAFACDIVVASEAASFIQSFSNVGLIPDSGGTFFLPRIVGMQKAAELMMLGKKISAEEAHALGLVARVFPPSEFNEVRARISRTSWQRCQHVAWP